MNDITQLSDAELSRLIHDHVFGPWPEDRCPVCGWFIRKTVQEGCIIGNCSFRPLPQRRADEPRDFVNDPHMTMTLIHRLLQKHLGLCLAKWSNKEMFVAQPGYWEDGGFKTLAVFRSGIYWSNGRTDLCRNQSTMRGGEALGKS